jgi:predicted FMN-binding regulatory protein PaiB
LIFYDMYADVPPDVVDAFARERELGRLITVGADGVPHVGLYPFVYTGDAIEMHLHRKDEQLADLRASARCAFEIDEVLGTIPSYWIHPENAVMATAYHRTAIFECRAEVSEDPAVIAAQQTRIMARYQPEGGFKQLSITDPIYQGALATIAALRLEIASRRVKFKLGQNRPAELRAKVVGELRRRGRPNDARAADALQWTIDREARHQAHVARVPEHEAGG